MKKKSSARAMMARTRLIVVDEGISGFMLFARGFCFNFDNLSRRQAAGAPIPAPGIYNRVVLTPPAAAHPLRIRCASAAHPLRIRCASAAHPLRFHCAATALPLRW
jgi:hypothetical protein